MTTFQTLIDEIQDSQITGSTKKQLKALTRITDLFVAGAGRYSTRQTELFDEVFKTIVGVIETKTRIKLAQHLATDTRAPPTIVRAFAFDDNADVAGPVLSQSAVLGESDLVASASTRSQGHLYAIAQRQTLSEVLTDILIRRGERIVLHAVAKNAGARISDRSFRDLILKSSDDPELALHVGSRRDIPRHHFLTLLENASAAVRERIVAANPGVAETVQGALTEVVDEINLELRAKSSDHAKARKKVRRLKYWKELGEAKVHAAARGAGLRAGRVGPFSSRALSHRGSGARRAQRESRRDPGRGEGRRLFLGDGEGAFGDEGGKAHDDRSRFRPRAREFRAAQGPNCAARA